MTSFLLGGLAALIVSSIGVFASSADAFSSVLSRRLSLLPAPLVRRLAQDVVEAPRVGDDQAATPQPPSGGNEVVQPPAEPSSPSGDQAAGTPPPAADQGGSPPPSDGQPAVAPDTGGTGGEGESRPAEKPPSGGSTENGVVPPFVPKPDGTPGSAGGVEPGEGPRMNPEQPRGPEDGMKRNPENRPPQSGDEGQGMSDDERQAQDEARQKKEEERQKAMEAKQLARMKRDIKRRASELKRHKTSFKRYVSKGLTIPADCSEAMTQAESIITAVQSAESMEAMQEVDMESLQDHFDTLNECRQRLDQLSRLPQMLKRFDSQIRQIERQWNRTKKGAPESAQDAVALGDKILSDIKAARASLNEKIKTGEIEDFETVLEDEIIGKFDDLNAATQQIDAAKNAKRFVAQFARQLKEEERMIAKLKKLKKDTSELEDILARTKDLYARIKGMKSSSEDYVDAVNELADLGQEFAAAAGGNEDVGGMIGPIRGPSPSNGGGGGMGGGPSMGPEPGSIAP